MQREPIKFKVSGGVRGGNNTQLLLAVMKMLTANEGDTAYKYYTNIILNIIRN